jgi:hypothetical protein
LEVTHTIDVSRGGLLLQRAEPCEVPARVWVAFPYDANGPAQPETPATVVRVERDSIGGFRVALKLALPPRHSPRPFATERRKHARFPFALPIFVRPPGAPWPEESMTRDISRSGVRFETAQLYKVGQDVAAKIAWGEWGQQGEIPGRVLRVERKGETRYGALSAAALQMDNLLTTVAVCWNRPLKS